MAKPDEMLGDNVSKHAAAPAVATAPARVRIILEEREGMTPGGQFIGHNGIFYKLIPGEVASVPVGVLDILDHAVEMAPVVDGRTRQVIGYRKRRRFPYRRVSAEEAEALREVAA